MTLLLLFGCPSPTATDSVAEAPACVPAAELAQVREDFGSVYVGQLATAEVEIKNPGDCLLTLTGAEIEDPDLGDGFAVAFSGPVLVEPGESAPIKVKFTPTAEGPAQNGLLVQSDAPDTELWVRLEGQGEPAPDLTITPEPITFEGVPVGCTEELAVTLHNPSSVPVEVSDLSLSAGTPVLTLDLEESTNGPLPWTIPPGANRALNVVFAPVDDQPAAASLQVTSTDFDTPSVALDVIALAEWPEPVVQTWTWSRSIDVIFAVNTANSMRDVELSALTDAWTPLVETLVASGADYQLAVVTQPDGCVVSDGSPFVTEADTVSDQVAALSDMVELASSGGEEGLAILANATDPAAVGAGGCNEGLMRAGAPLAVVGYTDVAEASPRDWSTYLSVFQGRVASPEDFTAHAVTGDVPDGCEAAEAGSSWFELVDATDGQFYSICDDLSATATVLAEEIGESPPLNFELSAFPLEGGITVEVDGVPTSAFSYASADNGVVLDEEPPNGATVTITYYPVCASR